PPPQCAASLPLTPPRARAVWFAPPARGPSSPSQALEAVASRRPKGDDGSAGQTERNPQARRDVGARPQAEARRALEEGEEPARDARRAAGADRGRLRARPGGGPGPPEVVGALPRQAEGGDVHAPDQARRRARVAGRPAGDRRDLEPLRPRRRR